METISIKGFIPNSLTDWDGKVATVLFFGGCNFRCGYCHNKDLVLDYTKMEDVNFENVISYLERNKDMVDGVVLTGGEPCLSPDLKKVILKIKKLGLLVKLDTNGSFPNILRELIDGKFIDFVAMDIKYPAERYNKFKNKIMESVRLIINSGIDHEFRCTAVPTIVSKEDMINIAKSLKGGKMYVLQQFRNENCLNEGFEKIKPYSKEKLEEFARKCSLFIRTNVRC